MENEPGYLSWAALILGWFTWGYNMLMVGDPILAFCAATGVVIVLGFIGLSTGD